MSIRVMSDVWERANVKGSELLVLLAIADQVRDDGWGRPSMKRIAEMARMTERAVQKIVRRLEEMGLIQTLKSTGGRAHTNWYRVANIPERETPNEKPRLEEKPRPAGAETPNELVHPNRISRREEREANASPKKPRVTASLFPAWIEPEVAQGWLEHRRALRKPVTERGVQLIVKELDELRAEGFDPNVALDHAVARGWQGLKAEWIRRDLGAKPEATQFDVRKALGG